MWMPYIYIYLFTDMYIDISAYPSKTIICSPRFADILQVLFELLGLRLLSTFRSLSKSSKPAHLRQHVMRICRIMFIMIALQNSNNQCAVKRTAAKKQAVEELVPSSKTTARCTTWIEQFPLAKACASRRSPGWHASAGAHWIFHGHA